VRDAAEVRPPRRSVNAVNHAKDDGDAHAGVHFATGANAGAEFPFLHTDQSGDFEVVVRALDRNGVYD
jgi:hypothetical protein